MGKLPSYLSDPFETLLYNISNLIIPILYKLKFTPNIVTTIGNIIGIMALYFLYCNNIYIFIILCIIRQLFDCMDGEMARKYKLTSKFGDIYEHVSDITFFIFILIITLSKIKNKFKYSICLIIIGIGFFGYWSCESEFTSSTSEFQLGKQLCRNKSEKLLKFFRYTGAGMSWVYFYIILLIFMK